MNAWKPESSPALSRDLTLPQQMYFISDHAVQAEDSFAIPSRCRDLSSFLFGAGKIFHRKKRQTNNSTTFYSILCLKQMLGKGGTAVVLTGIHSWGEQLLKKSYNLLIPCLHLWLCSQGGCGKSYAGYNFSTLNVLLFNRHIHKEQPHRYDPAAQDTEHKNTGPKTGRIGMPETLQWAGCLHTATLPFSSTYSTMHCTLPTLCTEPFFAHFPGSSQCLD